MSTRPCSELRGRLTSFNLVSAFSLPKIHLIATEEDLGDAEIEVRWLVLLVTVVRAPACVCVCVCDVQIDEDPTAGVKLDVSGVPMSVTFYQIGKGFLVDVDIDEECCATSTVLVCVTCCIMV